MNGTPPLLPPPPRKPTGWIVYGVIVSFLLVLTLLVCFGLMAFSVGGGPALDGARHRNLEEQFVTGDEYASQKIVEIELTGVISYDHGDGSSSEGMVGELKDQLDQAVRDKRVKAIVLRINSPGGEVVASDAIYRALAEVRDNADRPMRIVACIETVGASGAYYAAMGTDYIVANELSITASIGVIMQTLSFGPHEDTNSLMHKLGIKSYTFKSGKLKDILNPTRNPTDEEIRLVNDLIGEVYDKFVGIVADERELDLAHLKNTLADGRIVSGKQAKEANLVDEVGYFEDAVAAAMELANLKKAKVVRYVRPFSLRNVLRLLSQPEERTIQVQFSPNSFKLHPGRLYFLPAYMFQ